MHGRPKGIDITYTSSDVEKCRGRKPSRTGGQTGADTAWQERGGEGRGVRPMRLGVPATRAEFRAAVRHSLSCEADRQKRQCRTAPNVGRSGVCVCVRVSVRV